MNSDDQRKAEIVEAHLRLVISIAKTYSQPGQRFLDLVDHGKVGLMKAVDCYAGPAPQCLDPGEDEVRYLDMMSGTAIEADERFEEHATPFIRTEIEHCLAGAPPADQVVLERLEQLRAAMS